MKKTIRSLIILTITLLLLVSQVYAAEIAMPFGLKQVEICGITVDKRVRFLDLSHIPLTDTQELEQKLHLFPNLQKVDMIGCGISDEDMEALNQRHPEIDFVWTVKIGPIDLRTDVRHFMPYLYGYKLTPPMCANLKYCHDLICVDFGHMEMDDCSFLQDMPQLEILILADTPLSDLTPIGTLTNLKYLEVFMSDVEDFWPLLNCSNLVDLNLAYTTGLDFSVFQNMTQLERLWMPSTYITAEDQQILSEALPNTAIVYRSVSSTGKGWRFTPNYYIMRDMFGMFYSWE